VKASAFVLILLTLVLVAVGTLLPGPAGVPVFVHAWWFKGLGLVLLLGSLKALIPNLFGRKWGAALSHVGAILLLVAAGLDLRAVSVRADLAEDENITSFVRDGRYVPLGFSLRLLDFREDGFISRVRIDDRHERTIRPSHPASYRGRLLLQDGYEIRGGGRDTAMNAQSESPRIRVSDHPNWLLLRLDPLSVRTRIWRPDRFGLCNNRRRQGVLGYAAEDRYSRVRAALTRTADRRKRHEVDCIRKVPAPRPGTGPGSDPGPGPG
jgi:hypothetical protein